MHRSLSLRMIIKVLIGGVLGLALSPFGVAISPHGIGWAWSTARACGIGPTATMLANKAPALSFPSTPDQSPDTPLGLFPLNYTVNQTITLTEDLSKLPTAVHPEDYGWTWDFGDGAKTTGYTVTHTYAKAGDFVLRVGLIDPRDHTNDDPRFDSAQIHITTQVFDKLPIAVAHSSGEFVQVGNALSYDATGSYALDGSDLTYTWNFGDATSATGLKVTHTFSALGQPVNRGDVTLVVQDKRGAISVATVPVTVAIFLPSGNVTASATQIHSGETVTFDASKSSAPAAEPDDRITGYHWSFGDGSNQDTVAPKITYTYAKGGNYTVTLQAIDRNNLPGISTVVIHVTDAGPFGLGNRAPIVLGSIGLIAAILLLALGGAGWNVYQERKRKLALAALRRSRKRGGSRH